MKVVEIAIDSVADALEAAKSYTATLIAGIPVIQVTGPDGSSFLIIQSATSALCVTS